MSHPETQLPSEVVDQLAQLESQVRRLALLRGMGLVGLVLGAGLAAGLAVDFLWELSLIVRIAMLLGVILATIAAVWQFVVRPCVRDYRLLELAAVVETAHPVLRERLTSIIEFHDPDVTANYHGSDLMRELLSRQTVKQIRSWNVRESIPAGSSFRTASVGLGMVLLLAAPLAVSPSGYQLLIARFLTPWANLDSASDIVFDVHDGNRTVPRGRDVTIRVSVSRRSGSTERPEHIWLNRVDPAGETEQRRMEFDDETRTFQATIPHVLAGFDYSVSSGRARSRRYRIETAPIPEIVAARLHVVPPTYTALPERRIDGVVGEIPVFERSRLAFELTFNKPVEAAELEWLDRQIDAATDGEPQTEPPAARANEQMILSEDRRSARLELTALAGGTFAFRLRDRHSLTNENEPQRRLIIARDAPPELAVAGRGDPQEVRPDEQISVGILARDDVGLGAVELHYETATGKSGILSPNPELLGRKTLATELILDPTALGLKNGAVVTYRVRAADRRPVPEPNEVWSEPRMLTVRRDAESLDRQELAAEQRRLEQLLEALKRDLAAHREKVADLAEDAKRRNAEKREFDRDPEIPPLIAEEWDFAERLAQLATRFANNPILEPLADKAREIAQNPLDRAGDELRRAAELELPEKVASLQGTEQALAETEHAVGELQTRFQELSEIVRDLLELGRLAERAGKLADEAAAFQESQTAAPAAGPKTPEGTQSPDQTRQQALMEEQQELADDLEDLLDRRPELVEAARKAQLERLAELADLSEALSKPQERLADSLERDSTPPSEDADARQSAATVHKQQRRLAQESAELALRIAQTMGPDAPAARHAAESARQSLAGRAEMQSGNLTKAGQFSQNAAHAAQDAARELKSNGVMGTELAEQARALAGRQEQLAQELAQLARRPAARQAVRQLSQRELGGAARELEQRFAEVSQRLAADPLDLPQESRQAAAAEQQTGQARQTMQDLLREMQEQTSPDPAMARQAAQALRDAAQAARGGAAQAEQHDSPIPEEIGSQVTEAAQKLQQAAEQLSRTESSPSNSGKNSPSNSGPPMDGASQNSEGQSSPSASGSGKSPNSEGSTGKSPENPLAQSVQSLKQAAQSLAQAAQQLQPGQAGAGTPSKNAEQSPPNSQPPGENGDGLGGGAASAVDLTRLEAELGNLSTRNWGTLPGELQSQILQGSRQSPDGEYAPLIRIYFEEIAKPPMQSPAGRSRGEQ